MTFDFNPRSEINLIGLISEKQVRAAGSGVDRGVVDTAIAFLKGEKAPTAEALVFLLEKLPDPYGAVAGGIRENLLRGQPEINGPVIVQAMKILMASPSRQAKKALGVLVNLISGDVKTSVGASLFSAFTSSDVPRMVASDLQRYGSDDSLVLLSLGTEPKELETDALRILGRLVEALNIPGSLLAPKSIEAHAISLLPVICGSAAQVDGRWAKLLTRFLDTILVSSSLQEAEQPGINPKYAALSRNLADSTEVQLRLALLGVPEALNNLESGRNGDTAIQQLKGRFEGLFENCVARSDGYATENRPRTGEIKSIVQFVVTIYGREFWTIFARDALVKLLNSSLFAFCDTGQQSTLLSTNKDLGESVRLVRDSFQYVKCLRGGKVGKRALRAVQRSLKRLGVDSIISVARSQEALLSAIKESADFAPRMTGFRLVPLCRELKVSQEQLGRLAVTLFSYNRTSSLTLKAMCLAANPEERKAIVGAIEAYQATFDRSAPFAMNKFTPPRRFSMILPRVRFRLFG